MGNSYNFACGDSNRMCLSYESACQTTWLEAPLSLSVFGYCQRLLSTNLLRLLVDLLWALGREPASAVSSIYGTLVLSSNKSFRDSLSELRKIILRVKQAVSDQILILFPELSGKKDPAYLRGEGIDPDDSTLAIEAVNHSGRFTKPIFDCFKHVGQTRLSTISSTSYPIWYFLFLHSVVYPTDLHPSQFLARASELLSGMNIQALVYSSRLSRRSHRHSLHKN